MRGRRVPDEGRRISFDLDEAGADSRSHRECSPTCAPSSAWAFRPYLMKAASGPISAGDLSHELHRLVLTGGERGRQRRGVRGNRLGAIRCRRYGDERGFAVRSTVSARPMPLRTITSRLGASGTRSLKPNAGPAGSRSGTSPISGDKYSAAMGFDRFQAPYKHPVTSCHGGHGVGVSRLCRGRSSRRKYDDAGIIGLKP